MWNKTFHLLFWCDFSVTANTQVSERQQAIDGPGFEAEVRLAKKKFLCEFFKQILSDSFKWWLSDTLQQNTEFYTDSWKQIDFSLSQQLIVETPVIAGIAPWGRVSLQRKCLNMMALHQQHQQPHISESSRNSDARFLSHVSVEQNASSLDSDYLWKSCILLYFIFMIKLFNLAASHIEIVLSGTKRR